LKKLFIGFYNISVVLTYLSLLSAVCGIMMAINGRIVAALICLVISGVCDCFDGKVARAISRTEDEKTFGIQIDSLCDLVAFGAAPAIICYCDGLDGVFGVIVLLLYVLDALIRLAYFNVTEQNRQRETDELRKYYNGLPVTSIAFLLPIIYLLKLILPGIFTVVLGIAMFVIAILFVANIKVKKIKI